MGSPSSSLARFHPFVRQWFAEALGEPTEPQERAWPAMAEGRHLLLAAPTGSGKTLAAFLSCVDELFTRALERSLEDQTTVLYVSPLKALGNDVQKNLCGPLAELDARARAKGERPQPVRVLVRTGDTKASERAAMVKRPPHILVTTPESLYLYLTAARSRATLASVRTVIVDELHAVAKDKRGSHLMLSLERLEAVAKASPQRVGLSATQKPLELLGQFLVGQAPRRPLERIEVGHRRAWELHLELPDDELTAVATHEMWGQLYARLEALAASHRTLLVFVNTRKLAERVAHDLGERIGAELVAAHHGSLSKELRLAAEERLKAGQLKVMVATASLELGIDIGSIDLVVQVGSPRSIATFLQRAGRSGHHKSKISKAVLYAMTRDELLECAALLRAVREGELDAVRIPELGLDVLAQQVVAEVAAREWSEAELFERFTQAWPYRRLEREQYEKVVALLSEGISTNRGRSRVHLHRDRVHGMLRARRGARLTALQNGGAIPDTFTYPVVAEPEGKVVGTLDEDFAVESNGGDVFLLGTTAWKIRRIEAGTVRVEDAHGQAPTVPFWQGEAPSRTDELSAQVSRLREDIAGHDATWLEKELGLPRAAAEQLSSYVRAGVASLGAVPTVHTIVAERFFDEAGGMQLLLHAPFGSRINRAFGLALRKRFCRTFDFELQAAATDDGVLLSLGEQHSFPLAEVFDFLAPATVEATLGQAVLRSPLFATRFRWTANRALALARYFRGRRVPPQLQRARAEDLLGACFPALVACQDNHGGGDVELPDHPLVQETLFDCLHDAMDVEGLKEVLRGLREGEIRAHAVDVPEPSVFAHALLNSALYTFLDDAPLEERRARAVSVRRTLAPEDAVALGALDPAAIAQVIDEARPEVRDEEETHDALLQAGLVPEGGANFDWLSWAHLASLAAQGRVTRLVRRDNASALWVPVERLGLALALFPEARLEPPLQLLPNDAVLPADEALRLWCRGLAELLGPFTTFELTALTGVSPERVEVALLQQEAHGQLLRGTFRPGAGEGREWCDRRLLQRIHRLTVGRLRREIEPIQPAELMRFLFRWHHLEPGEALRGGTGLLKAVTLLQGHEAPAAAWELELFPARMHHYHPDFLERACWAGEVAWGRLTLREAPRGSVRRGTWLEPRALDASPPRAPTASSVRAPPLVLAPSSEGRAVLEGGQDASAAFNRLALPSSDPRAVLDGAGPRSTRAAPLGKAALVTFIRREDVDWLLCAARPEAVDDAGLPSREGLSAPATAVLEQLIQRGASFFTELVRGTRRLGAEVEGALWELVARGLVTADAVNNMRVLLSPKARRRQRAEQRGGPGRWSTFSARERFPPEVTVERLARLFLTRYGIVFRDLVAKEALAPPWRELLAVYRRLEARGELRGGRFVAGFAGEQFALPEAVAMARALRREGPSGKVVHLAAVDPLNLTGIVTPGPRVPAQLGRVITYVDGVPAEQKARRSVRGAKAVGAGTHEKRAGKSASG